MVTGTIIQQKVYRGYAIAANKIGLPFNQFRPTTAFNPVAGTPRATLNVQIMPTAYTVNKALMHDDYKVIALVDGTQTQVGDYLVGPASAGTYFIATMQPLLPIGLVRCIRTLSILRVTGAQHTGLNPRGGDVPGTETTILSNWPAWSDGGKGRHQVTEGNLPGDVAQAPYVFILPILPVPLYESDIIIDDVGFRYVAGAVENTSIGWRIYAMREYT